MKKQILALSLGLMTIGAFAQKDELKAAEKALKKDDFKTAKEIILTLEGTEATMDAKYKAQYYFVKGQAYGKSDVTKAAEAYNNLFAYEKEIGKSKYTKDAQPKLNDLIKFVSTNAIKLYNDDKDYKNAAENFYLTYKLSPADTSFLYNAAVSASLAEDYDTSLSYYKELQDVGYTGITTQYFAVNKETGVEEDLNSKSNRDTMVKFGKYINPTEKSSESKQGEIIKNISYILINQGKTDEAIVAIKEARKSNPKDLNLLLNEAQLYIKLEQMDKFGVLMQEAIELDPTNPTLFYNLGVVNANEKKNEEAIEYYKKAIELKPDYGDAYMNLAITILSGEQEIVTEMNQNLSNIKKYDELEIKQKDLYRKALPYLEKADEIKRTQETVKSLLNIYDILRMNEKADVLRPIYKKMREQ
ncbi:tetratricopeptide repeat protein [uncultured Polaribacter sp.]|uniref:tetratricopeptide repeat protein n=1 Tax=uncultured Polaribacter sp. TaxID=174711 RepID=UPI0030D92FC6|tara:strand:- start:4638 stop:5885 length:1248 start_codon:yes stop_codon:yes gene_type:complete